MWNIFRVFKHFDIPLLVAGCLLSFLGLVLLYASSQGSDLSLFYRQALFLGAGFACYIFFSWYDYHRLAKSNRLFYVVLVGLLVYVLFFTREIRGSSRWIELGFFNFQPAEFAKIVIIVGLSRWLYLRRGEINSWKNILLTAVFTGIPAALILFEPDLGSTIILVGIWAGTITVSWINKKYILGIFLIGLVLAGVTWQFFLEDFQRQRIQVFLDPGLDPKGRGYNVRQAIIAVGSGELFGRGLGRGLQSQLKFLPERQTDFIFATAAEEIGFVGSVVMLSIYALLLTRLWRIHMRARDELGRYIASGVFFMFFFQVVINIGMNIGLLPVTGIPLPFLSYGGSSLIVVLIGLGIAQNVALQSRALRF